MSLSRAAIDFPCPTDGTFTIQEDVLFLGRYEFLSDETTDQFKRNLSDLKWKRHLCSVRESCTTSEMSGSVTVMIGKREFVVAQKILVAISVYFRLVVSNDASFDLLYIEDSVM